MPSSKLTTLALLNILVLPFSKHKITSVLQSCSFPLVCDEILQLCHCVLKISSSKLSRHILNLKP